MLIIGLYPQQFLPNRVSKPLAETFSQLQPWLSSSIILHVLPMWESEGDGGFAVSSWSLIDQRLGDLKDLERITSHWRTAIDGIFNHVAWGHPIVQSFLKDPKENANLLHAIQSNTEPDAPYAPRGGSVYLNTKINDDNWYIWQTFGKQAVDINLSNDQVRQQVEDTIKLYSDIGVWGLRLDALGYYGKAGSTVDHDRNPGGVEVHNSDGIAIAEEVIAFATEAGMQCLLQIDSDRKASLYKNAFLHHPEPRRVCRRLICLSYAAMSDLSRAA